MHCSTSLQNTDLSRSYTCALHPSLVQNAVKDVALLIVILLLEDEGRDLNQEAGQLSLHGIVI